MHPTGSQRISFDAAQVVRLVPILATGALMVAFTTKLDAAPDAPTKHPSVPDLLVQTAPPAGAAGSSATAPPRARNPDQKFAEEAASGGMAEVEAGKLAQSKATSGTVKAFAEQMVSDHGRANAQLKQLALSKGITLPTGPGRSQIRALEKAGKLQGADFDREYMKLMVAEHKRTVSLFEKEARNGKDTELKSFASGLLPDLQRHLQRAESIEGELKKGAVGQGAGSR